MTKNLIEKEITEYGHIYLHVNFRNTSDFLAFGDETEFQAFVFLLRMMTSMNAASVEISVPDQEETEKGDRHEQAAPEAEDKAAEE